MATAIHSHRPKQFTRLRMWTKTDLQKSSPALQQVLEQQGRWQGASSSIRSVGGNQAAESEWGCRNMVGLMTCTHRGGGHLHSTANMLSAMHLAHQPGLQLLGVAWARWFDAHCDVDDPAAYFTRSGWTGKGGDPADDDLCRIVGMPTQKKKPAARDPIGNGRSKPKTPPLRAPSRNIRVQVKKRPSSGAARKKPAGDMARPASGAARKKPACTGGNN